MKKIPVYGLHIYPSSVSIVHGSSGALVLHGDSISDKYSDFHLIFRCLYPAWEHMYLMKGMAGERMAHEGFPSEESFLAHLVKEYANYHAGAYSASALDLLGRNFSDDIAVFIYENLPPEPNKRKWLLDFASGGGKRKHRKNRWREDLRSFIRNNDGIFWEFYTVEEQECNLLRETHAQNPALRIRPADFYEDYYYYSAY